MSDEPPVTARSRLSAWEVAHRSFTAVRRGLDPDEVQGYLALVAEELAAGEQREEELERELAAAEDQALHPDIDEATLTAALGQRSAAVLRNAHEEAARIVQEAERSSAAQVRDAHQKATEAQVRAEATAAERIAEAEIAANGLHQQARQEAAAIVEAARAEGERIVDHAREQGRTMLDQAQEARRRVLADMAERRRAMTAQIDQFRAARDELAAAVLGVRKSVDRVVDDLSRADDAARAAAAQAAHRHPIEATEVVLVAEAEQAAAEIGARTGAPADLEAAAARPLSIDDIRTVVPPGGRPRDDLDVAGGLGSIDAEWDPGAPTGSSGGGTELALEVESELTPTDPGRPVGAPAAVTSFVFDDLGGGGGRSGAEDALGSAAPAPPEQAAPREDRGRGAAGEDRDESSLERSNGDADVARALALEAESLAGDVLAESHAGDAPAGAVGPAAPTAVEVGTGADLTGTESGTSEAPAGAVDDDIEGLFARLRASREAADQAGDPEHARGTGAPAGGGNGDQDGADGTGLRERDVATRAKGTGQGATRAPAGPATERDVASAASEAGPAGTPVVDRALARRTELLGPVGAVLARRLKRALQDDQNRLLERLRSGPGGWSDDLLPNEEDQRALYARAARSQVSEAMAAGIAYARSGKRSRGKPPSPDDAAVDEMADELGATVVTLLRRRLSGEGIDEPVERVGAAYREWRGERIERLVGDCAVEAYSAGLLAGVPAGTGLRWVRNEASLGCADCEDNALGGVVAVGEEFPTGHLHPPAHAGCRCLVLPTPT